MGLPGKVSLRKAIKEHGGVVADVAGHYDVTRQTIYNWIDRYDMRINLSEARQNMREVAKDVLYEKLVAGDTGVAMFVMRHLSSDGEMMVLSPDVLALLQAMGLKPSDVMSEFEMIIRLEAAKREMSKADAGE